MHFVTEVTRFTVAEVERSLSTDEDIIKKSNIYIKAFAVLEGMEF